MTTIEKMTVEELEHLIDTRIDDRLTALLGQFELQEDSLFLEEVDPRNWEEVKQDIESDRWTPPPTAKSSLELLREDRDR